MPLARLPAPLLLGRTVTDSEVLESIPISDQELCPSSSLVHCMQYTDRPGGLTGIND